MKIYLTGFDGMLGNDLCPVLTGAGHELAGLAFVDITEAEAIRQDVLAAKPDWVLHLAAYTDVDGAESREELARSINVDGSRNVAAAAAEAKARLLVVSTDYVYEGQKTKPYVEEDPVGPLSVYGKTKLGGEEAARELCPDVLIARTAWLYGPAGPSTRGASFVDTMLRLVAERPRIEVVADQIGCPTYSAELVRGLVALIKAEASGVVHVTGSGQTSWFGFAREILRQAGHDPRKIQETTSERFARPAPRPRHSVLSSARFESLTGFALKQWPEALADYLARRQQEVRP